MVSISMAMPILAPTFASVVIFWMRFVGLGAVVEGSLALVGWVGDGEDWEDKMVAVFITVVVGSVEETADLVEKVSIDDVPERGVPSKGVEVGSGSEPSGCGTDATATDDGCSVIEGR